MSEEQIICQICGREFKNYKGLGQHLKQTHNMSSKDYYDKYFKTENDGICLTCGKETSFCRIRNGYNKYCSYKCGSLNASKETRQKISEALKGRKHTKEAKLKMSKALKGKKRTEEHKKNLSKALKGRKLSKEHKNKISKVGKGRKHTEESKLKMSKTKNKGANINGFAGYDRFNEKISWAEETRRDLENPKILNVKCTNCNEWFRPTPSQLKHRISGLNQNDRNRFYCSDNCKNSCSIFGQRLYQVNHPIHNEEIRDPYWTHLVKTRDENICQICGEAGTIAHHIKPVKLFPHEANDIDNGICVCSKCDKHVHSLSGCKTGQLANIACI